jgi:hypothetical protein
MSIPIFLSHPKPHNDAQNVFLGNLRDYLKDTVCLDMDPLTLGETYYDSKNPLAGIRRLMSTSNGVLVVALRRYFIKNGEERRINKHGTAEVKEISGFWMTSPWCHIEAAMAFQLRLPLLIFIESNVHPDGILEKGVVGNYLPELDLDKPVEDYLKQKEFIDNMNTFAGDVRHTWFSRGIP